MKKILNLKNIIFHLFLVFFLNLSLVSNSNAAPNSNNEIDIIFCQFNHVGDSEWSTYWVEALIYGQDTKKKNCKDSVKKYHLDFKTAKALKKSDVCYDTSTHRAFVILKDIQHNCNYLGKGKLLEFVGDYDGLNRFKIKDSKVLLASADKSADKNVSKYITKKKSNNTKAIEDIENLYSEGLLSKDECIRAKVKILKLPNASSTLCDNVNVKVLHKDDKPKEVEKKSTFITKKEPSTVKKDVKIYASLGELPFSSFYFYALDKNKNYLIGFVNPDPNSESKVVNNVSYRVGNLGLNFLLCKTHC
jgi:hypothetical protein